MFDLRSVFMTSVASLFTSVQFIWLLAGVENMTVQLGCRNCILIISCWRNMWSFHISFLMYL